MRPDSLSEDYESEGSGLTAAEVLGVLWKEYTPFPWEPRYDPISEVVFTILSQHTSDHNSGQAFKQLMDTFGSHEEVAKGDTKLIAKCIKVGGLAKIKAPPHKAGTQSHPGKTGLPRPLLPQGDASGRGQKTGSDSSPASAPKSAAIILCFALGMPAMAVDTHIYRVSKRLGLIGPKTSYEQSHDILEQAVEPEQIYSFHVALITHGRRVCKAPRPLCHQCVLAYGCPSRYMGMK